MKKVIIIICLFININLFSQKSFKSAEVIYTVKIAKESSFENPLKPNRFRDFQKKMNNFSEKLNYTLIFNENNSLFYLNSKLALDNEDKMTKLALAINKGDNIFFVDRKKNIILEQKSFLGDDFLVQSSISELKWQLINEKRIIGKYTCYKAKLELKNNSPSRKKAPFTTYIAWYCPDIPFSYGPFDFNGLPGLILEFSIKERTYLASTIKLKKESIVIDMPTKGKLVKKEELNTIGKEAFKYRK